MKVAYVTPYYNGAVDGRYGRFHDWVHALRDMDDPPFEFEVHAFAASNPDGTLASEPLAALGEATELWGSKKNKLEYLLNAPRVRRDLGAGGYDLVHVLVMDLVVYPTTLLSVPDVPLVVGPDIAGWAPVRDGDWMPTRRSRLKRRLGYRIRRGLVRLRRYDRAVAFGTHHRAILGDFGIPPGETTLLRPGVDGRFRPGAPGINDPPELLYVGDFSEHKGYPLFLRALARTTAECTARVVGSGDPRRDLIRSLGLADRVTVEGFVERADLPEYYRNADLHVVASVDETAGPNTQIEALASGVPVVVTDKPGINEYAPPGAAVSFRPRDEATLAGAIDTALSRLDGMTTAARRHADEFGAATTVDGLESLYRGLVG